ncbi:MAG: SH3 domain-containing protein, partial [Chloroflexi bacterium]|nr:SH3 domain-containing protein [Chloroflexota bacterium]
MQRALIMVLILLIALVPTAVSLAEHDTSGGTAPLQTGPYLTVNETSNVRGGPGLGFYVIGVLYSGNIVPVLGVSADSGWWYVNTEFGEGWVSNLTTTPTGTAGVTVIDPGPTATVTAGLLNVRDGAGTNALVLGRLARGQQVLVIAQNSTGTWLQVRWGYGIGWV